MHDAPTEPVLDQWAYLITMTGCPAGPVMSQGVRISWSTKPRWNNGTPPFHRGAADICTNFGRNQGRLRPHARPPSSRSRNASPRGSVLGIARAEPACWRGSIMRRGKPPGNPLICEFYSGDGFHKGPVLEIYPDGFFVETDAEVERGTVLEIHLENPVSGESVIADSIVEQRVEPTTLAPHQARGLELRIFYLTPEYSVLIGTMPPSQARESPRKTSERIERRIAEHDWASALRTDGTSAARSRRRSRGLGKFEVAKQPPQLVPLFERAGKSIFEEAPPAPRVLVIDDGELSDVIAMLHGLGGTPRRLTPAVDGTLHDWIPPTHLLVITAKRALSLGHSLDLPDADFAAIVVSDSNARMLHHIVHQLGYLFMVRRPVHPEALRTLLRQTLNDDGGRRASARTAIGCHARWKLFGTLRRHNGTLLDLSPNSCQLLVRDTVPLYSRIHIRIPADASGSQRVDVRGRVVRRATLEGEQRALGIILEDLTPRARDRLARVIAALASGPARFDTRDDGPENLPIESAASAGNTAADPQQAAPADAENGRERRRQRRAAFQRELVSLEAGSEMVHLSLIGRDLSVEGMRVEPNPDLQLDDRLRLAFYDCNDSEPLILNAVVTRNDGRLGSLLRFVGVDSTIRSRLVRTIEGLPSIESLSDTEPEAAWAAIGQLELVSKEPE
jgi:hypothetical protein